VEYPWRPEDAVLVTKDRKQYDAICAGVRVTEPACVLCCPFSLGARSLQSGPRSRRCELAAAYAVCGCAIVARIVVLKAVKVVEYSLLAPLKFNLTQPRLSTAPITLYVL
jgi:hypothetical protein